MEDRTSLGVEDFDMLLNNSSKTIGSSLRSVPPKMQLRNFTEMSAIICDELEQFNRRIFHGKSRVIVDDDVC